MKNLVISNILNGANIRKTLLESVEKAPSFSDFEKELPAFYDYLKSEIEDAGYIGPLYRGDVLIEEYNVDESGIDIDKWYYWPNTYDAGTIQSIDDIKLIDKIIDDLSLSFAELHQNELYFSDFDGYSWDEADPKFKEVLSKYFDNKMLDLYDGSFGWLLDEYAFRKFVTKVFKA